MRIVHQHSPPQAFTHWPGTSQPRPVGATQANRAHPGRNGLLRSRKPTEHRRIASYRQASDTAPGDLAAVADSRIACAFAPI